MAGRDGDVPDPPQEENQEEEEPSPDPDPGSDTNPEPAPPPKRGRPKLTKEEILQRISSRTKAKAKVTSTPQTRSKGVKEKEPLAGPGISSLIKAPTFELGTKPKTNPRKSVHITEELGFKSNEFRARFGRKGSS